MEAFELRRHGVFHLPHTLSLALIAESLQLSLCSYKSLRRFGLPLVFYEILYFVAQIHRVDESAVLECIEYFCGVAYISSTFEGAGFPSLGYDILKDPLHNNLCSPAGFIYALFSMLCLSSDGLAWFATVCSSWTWLAISKTRRSPQCPLGRNDTVSTMDGNMQVARCALLMALAHAKHAWWALEQPLRSLMKHHPAMAHVFKTMPFFEVTTHMGAFAADTLKPSQLYGNAEWILGLWRKKPTNFSARNVNTVSVEVLRGEKKITGSAGLKETQAYTPEFGHCVLDTFLCFQAKHVDSVESSDDEAELTCSPSVWETADLPAIARFLRDA